MLHTWSLALEEQFYLLWPLLIIFNLLLLRSWIGLLITFCALTLASLAASVYFTAHAGTFAFYQLPARAWEFAVGGLAVLLPWRALKIPSACWLALGWIGTLAIFGSAHSIVGEKDFPGWVALVPVIGTAATLIAGKAEPNRGVGIMLNSMPGQVIGRLSYSWYLWHWPALVLSAALFPNISAFGKIIAAAAALVIASVTHRFFENPIRFHPYLTKRPKLSIGLAVGLTLCSLSAAALSMRFADLLADAPEMKAITAAIGDIGSLPRQQCVSSGETRVKSCSFGDKSSGTRIVLFGDSHALQWFNPLSRIAQSHGWELITVLKSGCPAADIGLPGNAGFTTACDNWRAEAIQRIVSLRPYIVFVGNASAYVERKTAQGVQAGVSLDDWQNGTRRTIEVSDDGRPTGSCHSRQSLVNV